jgi:hypothetical protein
VSTGAYDPVGSLRSCTFGRLLMNDPILLAVAVSAALLAVSWAVRRFNSRRGAELSLAANLALNLIALRVLIWSAERAAAHGGLFIVVAVLLALTAAIWLLLSVVRAGALWMSLKGRFSETDYE